MCDSILPDHLPQYLHNVAIKYAQFLHAHLCKLQLTQEALPIKRKHF